MDNSVQEFFSNRSMTSMVLESAGSHWNNFLVKVKLNGRFDYLYRGYSDVQFDNSKLDIFGLLDNITGKFYVTDSYFMDNYLKGGRYISLYDLSKQIREDVNSTFVNCIYDNLEYYKKLGKPVLDSYLQYEENKAELQGKAVDMYISNFKLEKIDFQIYDFKNISNEYRCLSTSDILGYITDKNGYLNQVVETELNKTNERIYSHYSDIQDILVNMREKIGFKLLELDEINRRISELAKDTNSLETKKRNIKAVIDTEKMKVVNVTVEHNGNSLTFKYPTDQLCRMDISSWWIKGNETRNMYNNMFKDGYYRDDDIIAKIVKIEYSKRVLYEGKDISNK